MLNLCPPPFRAPWCVMCGPSVVVWKPLWLFISDVFCYWHCWHHSILPDVWSSHHAHTTSKSEIYTRWLVIVTKHPPPLHPSMSMKCLGFYLSICSSRFSLAWGFSPSYSEIFTQIYSRGGNYWDSITRVEIQQLNQQVCKSEHWWQVSWKTGDLSLIVNVKVTEISGIISAQRADKMCC